MSKNFKCPLGWRVGYVTVFAVSFGGLFTECPSIHPICHFSYVFTQFVLHHKISFNILDYNPAWKLKFCTKKKNGNRAIYWNINASFIQFSSVAQSCPTLCNPMNHSTPGLPVHHHLTEFTPTHVHRVRDAIQPSHPLSSPSPPAPNPSQHQSLFQWVNSSHEVAKVLEFQL